MKKLILLFSLLSISSVYAKEPLYNVETKINISSDKIMNYTQNLTLNNEFIFKYDVNVEDIFNYETYKLSLQDKGYTVEPFATNDDAGITIKKRYPQLDLISTKDKVNLNLSKLEVNEFKDDFYFQLKSGLVYDYYKASFIFDYSNYLDNEDIKRSELSKLFNLSLEVNLPSKSNNFNATTTNESLTYLKWDLKPGKINEVNFEFKQINISRLAFIIIVGALVTVGLIIFIVKKASNRFDEISDQLPKKEKKQKKKEEVKEIYSNGMTLDDENTIEKPIIEEKVNSEKQISLVTNNSGIDLMASQNKNITNNNQLYKTQNLDNNSNAQVNVQNNEVRNNNEVQDYTSVFNQSFNDNKKGE